MSRARTATDVAWVDLWGETLGAVAWDDARRIATFEFTPEFSRGSLDPAPIRLPIAAARRGDRIYEFPTLAGETFHGLPGLLADSLPDRFGHRVIDAWLAGQGRAPADFSPVERLCYVGRRAMGALEFRPALNEKLEQGVALEIDALVALASSVQRERATLTGTLDPRQPAKTADALLDLLRVGTSAGGARPKAVVAWNQQSGALRSGQVQAPPGFTHWLLKFDGVSDTQLGDGAGFGRIEYAYSLMARSAGIDMQPCRLLEEGGRAHFMTRRFDRRHDGTDDEHKVHLQSLCALGHFDYNVAGGYGYEQAFQVARQLGLPHPAAVELFRRMAFNVLSRNQDDHTKNIAFLMEPDGTWHLAPAFDLTFAYNPNGSWTDRHQMSIAGKRDDFVRDDLLETGKAMGVKTARHVLEEVADAVSRWPEFAGDSGVPADETRAIGKLHRRL